MKFAKEDFEKINIPKAIPLVDSINESFELGKINTVNRILCMLPNLLHESGDFKWLEEIASGAFYEGRKDLGNVERGDGVKYKGRSAIMVTGRANYKALTKWYREKGFDVDFVNNPKLLSTNKYAILPAIWFWEKNNLEKYADAGDFTNVCSIINTGRIQKLESPHKINGMEDRLKKYNLVKQLLKSWM